MFSSCLTSFIISPVGVIPCPTLTIAMGMLTLFRRTEAKGSLYFLATIMALFYGGPGVFLLKVYLDIPLLAPALYSAADIAVTYSKRRRTNASTP